MIELQNKFTIHIFGASGSGATTLAKAISTEYGFHFIDIDDAIWENTDPPFSVKRSESVSFEMVSKQLREHNRCVISGAFIGWGDSFKDQLDLVIYMNLPLSVRLERIQRREEKRFGKRILEGGDLYQKHHDFLEWVSQYDELDESVRSKKQHQNWLLDLSCPVVVITDVLSVDQLLEVVKPYLK